MIKNWESKKAFDEYEYEYEYEYFLSIHGEMRWGINTILGVEKDTIDYTVFIATQYLNEEYLQIIKE